jgi:ribonuclease Y
MDNSIIIIVCALAGVVAGAMLTYYILNNALRSKKDGIISEAEKEGETIKEKKILQAKEKFLELKAQHEREVSDKNNKVKQAEDRAKSKERELSQQQEQLKRKDKEIESQKENLARLTEQNQNQRSGYCTIGRTFQIKRRSGQSSIDGDAQRRGA